MKKSTYRLIDTVIFTAIAVITEALNLLLLKNVFQSELYTLSVTVTVAVIVCMRWKWAGIFPAVAGGLTFCLIQNASAAQYLVYTGGNAFIALLPLWFFWREEKKTAESTALSMTFALAGYLAVIVGRTLMSLFFEATLAYFMDFLASDLINIALGLIIIFIARRQNGVFESQELYLRRIAKEREGGIYG